MTTALALFFASGILFAAGVGIALLLSRGGEPRNVLEIAALSWFFGTGAVSFCVWVGGWFARGVVLQAIVAAMSLTLFVLGLKCGGRIRLPRFRFTLIEWLLVLVLLIEVAVLIIATFRHTLGWDGLLNWEIKARYAFLNGGALPRSYFETPGREFTHAAYPLAIPFTQLWLYLALGEPHQFWAKTLFPIYNTAGIVLMATLASRISGRRWLGLAAPALLFCVPQFVCGTGGAISGYSDATLSFVFLATVGYFAIAAMKNDNTALRFAAAFAALLPWLKREGNLLLIIAAVCAAICLWPKMRMRNLAALFLPAVVVAMSWGLFLGLMHVAPTHEYRAPMMAEIPDRLRMIGISLVQELRNIDNWSVLWFLALFAITQLTLYRLTRTTFALVVSIVAPLLAYAMTYLFSGWTNVQDHIDRSLSRLLMQLAPLVCLAIVTAVSQTLASRSAR